jgi:RHS repeat-associated protein
MSVRYFLSSNVRAILCLASLCCLSPIAQAQEYGAFHFLTPYDGVNAPLDLSRAAVAPTPAEACAQRNEAELVNFRDNGEFTQGPIIYVGLLPSGVHCGFQWLNMVLGPPGILNTTSSVTLQFATCAEFDGFNPAYRRPALCFINCPADQKDATGLCRLSTPKNAACPSPSCGNPVHPGTGNKFQAETDYRTPTGDQLSLVRYYNSGRPAYDRVLGGQWQHTYTSRVLIDAAQTQATYYRNDGKQFIFTLQSGNWLSDADVSDRLTELKDENQRRTGWTYYVAATEDTENYDSSGKLTAITRRSGLTQTLTYADGTNGATTGNGGFVLNAAGMPTTEILPKGLLLRVRDHFGRALTFGYDSLARIVQITDPGDGTYLYGYGANNNLVSVTYPDLRQRQYHYNEPAHTAGTNKPYALTGITAENTVRFATYKYDSFGRAVESMHHAGGAEVNRYQLNYNASGVQTTVTDPLGTARTYSFQTTLGVVKNTGIADAAGPEHGPAAQSFDANGNVQTRTDWNGNRTDYAYDMARNLETSRTEGLTGGGGTTPQTRTITTTWHSTFRLPTQIVEPGRTTSFTHDANGNVLTKTITAGSSSRTWAYTYNANGSVLTMDGPRTDVSDVTTYTYYANDATCAATLPQASTIGCRGQVETITNAVGHITNVTEYNAHGQPLSITDPNGLVTTLVYDARQRLTSRTVGGETTTYAYYPTGLLEQVTLPDLSLLRYSYDDAHRLREINDNLGNRIVYTLDAMGNRTQEDVRDPLNALAQTRTRVYDTLNRLFQEIGGTSPATQITQYGYDNQANLTQVVLANGDADPLGNQRDMTYDALNRLRTVTDPKVLGVRGLTQYGYDALDQLTSVTDPRNLPTTYGIDGLGNLNQQVSPDTGTTNNTLFDAAGNLKTSVDARGVTANHTYDALNRVSAVSYTGGSSIGYTWDAPCANGKGRLCSATRTGAPVDATSGWSYDAKGRVTQRTESVGAVTLTTQYAYEATTGRLASMSYPGGATLTYGYDANGRVTSIATSPGGATLLSGVTYHPFGRVKGWTWGNGSLYERTFDQDGRVASFAIKLGAAPQITYSLAYDSASRITGVSDSATPPIALSFAYDNLDRLTSAVLPATTFGYGYDAVGNRLSRSFGGGSEIYSYPATSNRLTSVTPTSGPVKTYSYDSTGNVTGDGTNSYAYDARGRLISATVATGAALRQYNALGQRSFRSQQPGITTAYAYDEAGRLIGEYTNDTLTSTISGFEYVYLDGEPVGVAVLALPALGQPAQYQEFLFVHPDHLGTPRLVTNVANQVRWRWNLAEPFGTNPANENPSALGVFPFSLRFPGQVLDKETNLHYNYFRDYDPGIGRYIQSDPVGLLSGLNTYGYANQNPLSFIDPSGLFGFFFLDFDDPNFVALAITVPPKVPGMFACNARCPTNPTGGVCPQPKCNPVEGYGIGSSLQEAIRNAKSDANSKVPVGCQAKHCTYKCISPTGDRIFPRAN